jgi:glycosyltransferase involved in cell wall biosynthesis
VKVLFFARVHDRGLLDLIEFYRQDLEILRGLGHDVVVETDLPSAARVRADVLWAYWWHSALPLVGLWRARRKPVVVTGAHDLLNVDRRGVRALVKRRLVSTSAQLASVNICLSEFEAKALRARTSRPVEMLYPGVDVAFYRPAAKSPTPSLVTVAQLRSLEAIERKGVDVAVAAAAHVRRQFPQLRLTVAGIISPEGQAWIDSLSPEVRQATDFRGTVTREEKRELLAGAWLYLQPSSYEGFGLAVAEALACGTPVVACDGGALRETVGTGGVIVPSREPEAVGRVVTDLLADEAELSRLADVARKVGQRYDIESRGGPVAEILNRLIRADREAS